MMGEAKNITLLHFIINQLLKKYIGKAKHAYKYKILYNFIITFFKYYLQFNTLRKL